MASLEGAEGPGDASESSSFGSAGATTSATSADNVGVSAASLMEMLVQDVAAAATAATTVTSSAPDARGQPGGVAGDLQPERRRGRGQRGLARKHQAVEFNMEVHLLGDEPGNDTVEYLQASVLARPLARTNETRNATSDQRPRRSTAGAPRAATKRARLSEPDGAVNGAPADNGGGGGDGAGAGDQDVGRHDQPELDPLALATQRYVGNLALCENGELTAPWPVKTNVSLIDP